MRNLIVFVFIIVSTSSWAQLEVEGIVLNTEDSLGLPGVYVYTDSLNLVITDERGRFRISLEKETDSLSFAFIGFVTRSITINSSSSIKVFLKPYTLVHYFDSQNIGLYFSSGVVNTPLGGELLLTSPYIFDLFVLKSRISFQTNLNNKTAFNAQVDLDNLVATKDIGVSLKVDYREVKFDNNLEFFSKSIESNFRIIYIPFDLILGYSGLNYSDKEFAEISESGPLIGMDYYLRPLHISILYKMAIYKSFTDYKAAISRRFGRIDTFLKYHKLKSYSELTFGIGIRFVYKFSDPNKY